MPVLGVTMLDNMIYVLRGYCRREKMEMEIYDNKWTSRYFFTVTGLLSPSDIVGCNVHKCLYISDIHNSVHRVGQSLSKTVTVTEWPVSDVPAALSVRGNSNVLVTCPVARKVKEFTTNGELVREVELAPDVCTPLHAVQLSSGELIVCHGENPDDPLHRVCLLDPNGQVVKSYGGPPGRGTGQMRVPMHMAVDDNDRIFVCERGNRRVSLLSPALAYIGERVISEQVSGAPFKLFLHLKQNRLYVTNNNTKDGELVAGRVFIFFSACDDLTWTSVR